MDITVTLLGMAGAGAVLAFASWRAGKPATPLKVRMAPWRLIVLLATCVLIFLSVHLFTLLGIKTDRPQ